MIANQDDSMTDTMDQIEKDDIPAVNLNRRDSLKSGIKNLETDIEKAQAEADRSSGEVYSHSPVSPEQANESKKNIVFLKKDLAKMKSEYEQLDQ